MVPPEPAPTALTAPTATVSPLVSVVYAAVMHIGALASVTVLTAIGKIDPSTGVAFIAALVGVGVGVGVSLNGTRS